MTKIKTFPEVCGPREKRNCSLESHPHPCIIASMTKGCYLSRINHCSGPRREFQAIRKSKGEPRAESVSKH